MLLCAFFASRFVDGVLGVNYSVLLLRGTFRWLMGRESGRFQSP